MSETLIAAPTQDDIAESESVLESADLACSVASSHGNHEAVGTDIIELDIADLETANAVKEPRHNNSDTIAPADASKEAPRVKKSSSVRAIAGKPTGGPPAPLVKKIIDSGTFGSGAAGKVPLAKSTATMKSARPSVAPALSRSTSSSAAVPAKASLTTTARVPAAPTAAPSRRLSIATAKPAAPPMSKPTLSASAANAKPTSGSAKSTTSTKPATTTASTKPAPSANAIRPSAVSPTGSVTSTSTRPKSAVSDGVKRPAGVPASRQSLPAGIKSPLALSSSGKLPLSRSSTSATATKTSRVTTSVPPIREVKEDNKALEDLQAQLKELTESLLAKSESVNRLDLKATQDDLLKAKMSLELARAEVEDLTQQRDAARASVSSISDSAAQSEEIIRLSRELSMTKDDLATANEMLNLTKISLAELSNNQAKDLEEAAKGRAEEVIKLRAAHSEEVSGLKAQKSELAIKVSDLEGELVTLRASIDSERAAIKANGHGVVPQISTGASKEELQRLHEAHNLKLHDLAAEHEKIIKVLKVELEAAHNKTEELNAEVQRKVMEIQYLEQDQEENQDQITRYVRFFRFKSFVIAGLMLGFLYFL
ncbi:hypothetical protein C0992_007398 [Termitomyces sp. T32_za158]|nr:hypothetical protein C0992_007398 [Termitomyces sp. T32_za158]